MPDRNRDSRDPRDPRAYRDYRDYRGYRDYDDYGSDDARSLGRSSREHPPQREQWERLYGPSDADRWRGGHFGRGPKGYRRSDERIREEISDRLMTHPDVDASDIEVRVENGIVTLAGTVDTRHEKRVAEFIAEDALGVDDVHNQLTVHHGFWATITGERAREREMPRLAQRESEVGKPSTEGSRANAARGAARRDSTAR